MSDKELIVADNVVVSMTYVLRLDNGEEIDSADSTEPLEYIHGLGQIIPGLEKELEGLNVGDHRNVTLQPADGYGEIKQEEVAEVDRENFPPDFELVEGKPVSVMDHESGEKYIAYIAEVHPKIVVLDFNHPLAGEILRFSVDIVNLRNASEDELAHGHVHHPGDGH